MIASFAASTYAWHLGSAQYGVYYSSAVKSMSGSWHALLFGAFDPSSTITIDKVPGAFALQALFARVLGFHAWVLVLPQVIAGVVALVVLFRLVRRWRGERAAVAVAAVFALTPIAASAFGHTMEDGALACCAVLAMDRLHVAVLEGRLRSLLWAAFWVGVGFEMKMLQAWLLLPALVGAYLLCAPGSIRRRIGHSALATAVVVALSSWWVVLLELVPATARPYVDGSTNNSGFAMVFGYNGLDRLGIHLHGAVQHVYPGVVSTPAIPHWQTFLAGRLATQISWLLPLALVVLAVGLWKNRRSGRTDPCLAGFVVLGFWLLPLVVVLSVENVPHAAYLVALAGPISALVGHGLVVLTRMRGKIVAVVLIAQTGWVLWVWLSYADFARWALGCTVALMLVLMLIAAVLAHRRWTVVAVASLLLAPAVWTLSTYDAAFAGTEVEAGAGPRPPTHPGVIDPALLASFGTAGRGFVVPSPDLSPDVADLWQQAMASSSGVEYPLITMGWYAAQSLLLTGDKVLPAGGFSLQIATPSFDRFQQMLRDHQVRMVMAGSGAIGGFVSADSSNGQIVSWIVEHCAKVAERDYRAAGVPTSGVFLYDCGQGSG